MMIINRVGIQANPINADLDRTNPECIEFFDNVNFLIYLKEPSKLINNCPGETLNCLNKINTFNTKHSSASYTLLSYDAQKRFVQIINDYFQYIYEYLKENADYSRILEPRRFDILYQFSLILWTWTDRSREFCVRLHDYHFIRVLFKYLSDEVLMNRLKLTTDANREVHERLMNCVKSITGSLHNLVKYENKYPSEWSTTNCVSVLLSLVAMFPSSSDLRLLAYFIVLNLSNGLSYLERLVELDRVIVDVVELVARCSSKISLDENLERRSYKIHYDDENIGAATKSYLISVVASRDVVWRLTELLLFLTKLAESIERMKYDLYERFSLKIYLTRILFNGNSIEKEYALKLLWKMCLDKHVAQCVREDLNLYSFLVGLSMNQFNRDRMLIKYANCILFALNSSVDSQPALVSSRYAGFPLATNVTTSSSSSITSSYSSQLFVTEEVEYLKI